MHPGDTQTMTKTETHLVIAVRDGVAELAAPPFLSWHDAQDKWLALDDERLAFRPRVAVSQLYYIVRSTDDPKYKHLLPRIYPTREAAAKALARRVSPGQTSRLQHWYLCEKLAADKRGWWHTASAARQLGYIATLSGGRAYLTPLAKTLEPA